MIESFKSFVLFREAEESGGSDSKASAGSGGDWRKEYITLEKGFIPPPKLRPIIDAFVDSGNIPLMSDTSKEVKLPRKSLFLVGGPVRDFLKGKSPKDLDLATNATPEQVAMILNAAGFRSHGKKNEMGEMIPDFDRSGKKGKEMILPFKPEISRAGDTKIWYLKGRDASQEGKPFVIGAVVDGEEFDIATFRKDAKVTDGQAAVDFVDNPHDDAARRDLTINSLYIELTKSDGENNKLYDPTRQGWHDTMNGIVRTVGKAEDRFNEDKLRVMRAIRFHCRFSKSSKMHKDIEAAIPRFKNLSGVAFERIRDEFLKGLLHPDIDPQCYLGIYHRTGLIEKVFPGVQINLEIPAKFRDKRDKPLALAWILQNNPIEKVAEVLGSARRVGSDSFNTGWTNQERMAVLYLLSLKEFDPNNIDELLDKRKGTGLSDDQIRDWVDMFEITDGLGRVRNSRPQWAKMVRSFADFKPDPSKLVSWHEKDQDGRPTGRLHPEIMARGLGSIPPEQRGKMVKGINKAVLSKMFGDSTPKN